MKATLSVLAVLCLAMTANAGISVVVGDPVDVGGGLVSYTVSLLGDSDADMPISWDGVFTNGTGVMNQLTVMSFTTPSLSYGALLGVDAAKDTHFLFADAAVTIPAGKSPAETATDLKAAFAYSAPFTLSRDLAQIVLPAGTNALMTGQAANKEGAKFDTIATIGLPEPATMSLLALGVVGLIRRR